MPFCHKTFGEEYNLSMLDDEIDYSELYNTRSKFKDYILKISNCPFMILGKIECSVLSNLSDDMRTKILMDSIIFKKLSEMLKFFSQ